MKMEMGMGKHVLSFSLFFNEKKNQKAQRKDFLTVKTTLISGCVVARRLFYLSVILSVPLQTMWARRGEASSTPLIGHCLCWRQLVKRLICF